MQGHHDLKLGGLFSKVAIYDIKIDQAYNDHAKITITGMVPAGDDDTYIKQALENKTIHVYQSGPEDGGEETVFRGRIKAAGAKLWRGVYYLELSGESNTCEIDIQKECQSFQDIGQTYDEVIQVEMEGVEGQYINDDPRKDEPIGKFTLQYFETRWMFVKRLLSRHNVGLVPDIESEEVAYWVDLPKGREPREFEDVPFSAYRTLGTAFDYKDNDKVEDADENDFFYYLIPNRIERYRLGDPVSFKGLQLRIIGIHSHLDAEKGVLYHDYTLTTENGAKQPLFYNEKIRGRSLEGSVIDRRKDFTKVHLFTIDEEQSVDKASWFRQPTYYTAGKDRGWCAMPELKDQLSLHFPTREENDCYLLDSTQVPYKQTNANVSSSSNSAKRGSGSKDDREIPASKFINAPNGQVLLLEDDLILFHSKANFSSLAFHEDYTDEKGKNLGITLRTEGDINWHAENITLGIIDGEISQKVSINSKAGIDFVCAMSSLIVDKKDGVHFSAPRVRLYPEIELMSASKTNELVILDEHVSEPTTEEEIRDIRAEIDALNNEWKKEVEKKNYTKAEELSQQIKKLRGELPQYSQKEFNEVCEALKLQNSDGELLSAAEKEKFYNICAANGIKSKESMALFLGSCKHENARGTAQDGGSGGGYLQLTSSDAHNKFLKSIGREDLMSSDFKQTQKIISEQFPMESAAWYWTNTSGKAVHYYDGNDYDSFCSINDFVDKTKPKPNEQQNEKRAADKMAGLSLVTGYAVKSWPSGISDEERYEAMWKIAKGNYSYKKDGQAIVVDEEGMNLTIPTPSGWYDRGEGREFRNGRQTDYDAAMKAANLPYYKKSVS